MALSGSRNVKKIKELPLLLWGVLNKIGLDEDKGINEPQASKQLPKEGAKPAIAWLVNAYETSLRSTEPTEPLFNTIPERINFINHIQELIDHGADPNQICAYHQPSFKKSEDDDLTVTDVSPVIYAYHLLEEEQKFDKNRRVSETKENTQQVPIYLFDILKKCPALDTNIYYYDQEGHGDYVSPISVSAGCNHSNTAYDIKLIQALLENPELEFRGKNKGIYYQLVSDHHHDCLTLFNNHGTFSEETEHLKEIINEITDEDYDFDASEYHKAFSLYFQTAPIFPFEKYGYQNIVNECEALKKVSEKLATTLNNELQFHLVTYGIAGLLKEIKASTSQILKEQLLKTTLTVLNKMPSVTILDEIPDQAIHKTLSDSKFDLSKGLDVPQRIVFEGGKKVLTPLCYAVMSKDKLLAATLMLSPKVQETEIADQAALKMAITQTVLPIIHMILIRLGSKLKNPQELFSYAMEAKNYAHPKNRCGVIRVLLQSSDIYTHISNDVLLNYLSVAAQQNDEGTATVLLREIKLRIKSLLAEIEKQVGITSIIPNRDEWLKQITQYCQEKIKHLNSNHFKYIVHWLYSLKLEHNHERFAEITDLTRLDLNKLSDHIFKLVRQKKLNKEDSILGCSLSAKAIFAIKNVLKEEWNAQNFMRIMSCLEGCYRLTAETDPLEAAKHCNAMSVNLQACFLQYGKIIDPKEITQFKERVLVHLYKAPEKKEDFITACRKAAEEYKEQDPCKAATYLFLIQKSERSTNDYKNLFGCLQKIAKAYCTENFNTSQGEIICCFPQQQVNFDELTTTYLEEDKNISTFEKDTILFFGITSSLIKSNALFSDPMKLNLVKYFIELAESYDASHAARYQGLRYSFACNLLPQINESLAKFSELDQALVQMLLGVKGVANIIGQFAPLFKICITLLLDQGDQEIKSSGYKVAASHYNLALALYFKSFQHSKGLIEVSRLEQIINDFFKNLINMDSFNRNDFVLIDNFISFQVKYLNFNQGLEKTVQFYLSNIKQFHGKKGLNQSETMTAFWYLRALFILIHNPMLPQLSDQVYQEIYDLTTLATESHPLIKEWTRLWSVIGEYAQMSLERLNPNQRDIINQRCISLSLYAYGLSCFYKIPSQPKEAIELIQEAIIKIKNTKKIEDFSRSMTYRLTLIDILCSDGQYEEAKKICLTSMELIKKNKLTKGLDSLLKCFNEKLFNINAELQNTKPVKVEEVAEAKQLSPSVKKKKRKPKKKTDVLPEEKPIESGAAAAQEAPTETKNYTQLLQTYFNEIHSNLLKCRHDSKAIDDILTKFDELDADNTFRKKWSFVEEEKEKQFCKRTKLINYKTISAADLSELKQLEDKVEKENDKLNDKDIASAERLAKAFKDHLMKDEGTYSALLKDDQEFERIKQRPAKQIPKNPVAEMVERKREEKKALAKLEAEQKREQAEQRKQHALMWREAKEAEKIAREAEAKKKESQGDQKQKPKQEQPPGKKLSKRLLLELVIKHLTFISATIGLNEIEQEEVSDLQLLKLETHYALLYDIFRCFAALRLYQQIGVHQTERLNLDILVNLRNMIHHYGARLSTKGDTVLQTAKEFAQGLPALLKDIKKPYLMESALTVKQIKDMAQALNFISKEDTRFELKPDMALVIDNTDIYKTLTKIVNEHAETVGGENKKQEQENEFNQIFNLVSHLKMVLKPVIEKHPEPLESLNEFYFRKFHAAKMIISHLGELGDPTSCQNYIDSALRHKSKAHGANLKKLTNIIHFYQFLLKCRGLHNRVGHAFGKGADFDINMLYKVCKQACLIERPDLVFLQNKESPVGPSFFAASVYGMPQDLYAHRTFAPGDRKSS